MTTTNDTMPSATVGSISKAEAASKAKPKVEPVKLDPTRSEASAETVGTAAAETFGAKVDVAYDLHAGRQLAVVERNREQMAMAWAAKAAPKAVDKAFERGLSAAMKARWAKR